MKYPIYIALAVICQPASAFAQTPEENTRQFHDFFAPFMQGDWNYSTQMTDQNGKTLFEGTDVRRYKFGVRGNFVIEDVYAEEDGALVHTGLQLIGLNAETGTLHMAAYWPWQATKIGDVDAEFVTQKDGNKGISGIARPAGQKFPRLNFDCSYLPDNRFHCTTLTTNEDGQSYISNQEIFSPRE